MESDYSKGNRTFFTKRIPSHIIADFNGDGLGDQAWILIKIDGSEYGLFAFLGKKSGGYRVLVLDEVKKESKYLNMGISMMPEGEYPTACAKGYGRCSEDQPKAVKFKYPGINYFVFESANSVCYWDDTAQGFKEIWMSD